MFNEILTGKATLETPQAPAPPTPLAPRIFVPSATYLEIEADIDRRRRSHVILGAVLAVACAVGVAVFEWAWESSQTVAETENENHYDLFVMKAQSYATEMCSCSDKRCAWSVQASFDDWARTTQPTDDGARKLALEHFDRYGDCLEKLTE